ncbi:hypothetical protein C0029_18815 [Halioglobus japonicus]|uniref:Uncharacterized protein n=1 Tax=Halioglobus japonicus TaxID=930805 RepID=A0AAP8MBD0_9GAMM|nr:hypothetical protein C0029_18815 [Halioglobus japonicus]
MRAYNVQKADLLTLHLMRFFLLPLFSPKLFLVLLLAASPAFSQKASGFDEFTIGRKISEIPNFNDQFSCRDDHAYETRLLCVAKNPHQWEVEGYAASSFSLIILKKRIEKIILTVDSGSDKIDRLLSMATIRAAYESKLGPPHESEAKKTYTKYSWINGNTTLSMTEATLFFYANNFSELESRDALHDW